MKALFGWDEPTLSIVWSCANVGMNFMVHLGWLYDRFGARVACALAVVLKLLGLGCMSILACWRIDRPWLFGTFFFFDAQATASAITLGQSEALQLTPVSRAGTAVSVAKGAFAVGPILWTYGYQFLFSPRVDEP